MKRITLLLSVFLAILPAISFGDDADKERIKELEKKMAELEKAAKAKVLPPDTPAGPNGLFDASGRVIPRISNSVVIIEGDKSVGTGFIVATGGKQYVYTAAHVFSGNSKLTIRNAEGTGFKKFGMLEAAEGADLVRLELLEPVVDSLEIAGGGLNLQINSPIAALGNGGGNGVISVERGVILGTSGDILEVDAGIIQGNSGGPVIDQSSGKAVGLVTHLTNERKDVWSEGTRQGDIRRFACRLNKDWKWKPMKIGTFLEDGKALVEFDKLTRLCFAISRLSPSESGLRMDTQVSSNMSALEILQKNKDSQIVKTLIEMNADLASRKTSLSDAELKKKFRSVLAQTEAQAKRSRDGFKPHNFAWFHRNQSGESLQARTQCIEAISQGLQRLK